MWCWRRLSRVPWTARRSNQSILKEITLNIHWKDWCWSWNSNTLATWCEELTHCKNPDAGKDWGQEEKGRDNRGWDDWMASPTWWTWVWASSRSWWWTEKPGVLQSMGLQRVGKDWVTEMNWIEIKMLYRQLSDSNAEPVDKKGKMCVCVYTSIKLRRLEALNIG